MDDEKNILILGLGNDCLGDDAVGLRVIRELRRRLGVGGFGGDEAPGENEVEGGAGGTGGVDLVEAAAGGMILLDLMAGYRGLILIDAIQTGRGRPGRIYRLTEDQLPAGNPAVWSAHHMGLRRILEDGRRAGCELPGTVIVYAVETDTPRKWRRGCSRRVERAVPEVVSRVMSEIPALTAADCQRRGCH